MIFGYSVMIKKVRAIVVAAVLIPVAAFALPFNDDMVDTQALRTGEISRQAPAETVAIGTHRWHVESKEDAASLTNPKNGDKLAALNGKRLFEINCAPCHGKLTSVGVEPSPLASKIIMQGPDLGSDYYAAKPDGLFYGTMHFGGLAVMPRVGFKLSPDETWDIVTFIRSIQKSRKK